MDPVHLDCVPPTLPRLGARLDTPDQLAFFAQVQRPKLFALHLMGFEPMSMTSHLHLESNALDRSAIRTLNGLFILVL